MTLGRSGKKVNKEEFIRRSRAIHGEKYDYSDIEFVNTQSKVVIKCYIHGDFSVRASNHYGGSKSGCKLCSGQVTVDTNEFIRRSKEIFGKKYDYSTVNCKSSTSIVSILCPDHGLFKIRANEHYGGPKRGCSSCTVRIIRKKMTTESFIEHSMNVHGSKYDYSVSKYVDGTTKITILCPKHGEFKIRPNAHYGTQKQGCKACAGRPEVTTQSFIRSSKAIYFDRFEYNKTLYNGAKNHLVITCKQHGDFSIRPNNHLVGNGGCKSCSGRPDISTEQLITELSEKFGDIYDYSKVVYVSAFTPITLICAEHGEFEKVPKEAAKSFGCPKCLKYSESDFLNNANAVHGDKYSYRKCKYITTKTKMIIICPVHGDFLQSANHHLTGRGCPACGVELNLLANRNPDDEAILYFLKLEYKSHHFWKIGITTHSIDIRYKLLKKDNVKIVSRKQEVTTLGKAINAENDILKKYKEHLEYRGHILNHAKGGTECFSLDILSEFDDSLQSYL